MMKGSDNELGEGIRFHFLNKKLEELRAIEKSLPPVKENNIIIQYWKPLAVAATVLFVITFAFLFNRSGDPQELFARNFEPYPNVFEPTQRGETDDGIRAQAFMLYEQKNYKESRELFRKLLTEKNEPELLFLLGNTNMALGDFEDAKKNFITVINDYDALDDQAKWYLSLCYLRAGDRKHAEELWKEIDRYPKSR